MSAASAFVSGVAAGGYSRKQRRQAHRLAAQLGAHRRFAGRAVIALVEQQVQRAPDGRQAQRELGIREIEQPSGAREHLLAARDSLLDRRAAGEERARDLARRRSRTGC